MGETELGEGDLCRRHCQVVFEKGSRMREETDEVELEVIGMV